MNNIADSRFDEREDHLFVPPAEFSARAHVTSMDDYHALCAEAATDYKGFWARLARDNISWCKPFTNVLNETEAPFYKWFEDGQLNVSYNCLDRNLHNGNAGKTAIIFEADGGQLTKVIYRDLHDRVCQFANGLKALGVKKGDRVVVYMPMSHYRPHRRRVERIGPPHGHDGIEWRSNAARAAYFCGGILR